MNIKDGTLAVRGHRNHMQAINEVFKADSLKNMVKKKILKGESCSNASRTTFHLYWQGRLEMTADS